VRSTTNNLVRLATTPETVNTAAVLFAYNTSRTKPLAVSTDGTSH